MCIREDKRQELRLQVSGFPVTLPSGKENGESFRKQENGFPVTLPQGMQMVRAFWQSKSSFRPYSTMAVW